MRFRLLVDGSESEAGMQDDGRDERGSRLAAWNAWMDEIIRTGRVVDVTEQALREGLGAFLITGMPRQADRSRVRRARRLGRRGDRARRSRRAPEAIDHRETGGGPCEASPTGDANREGEFERDR